MKRFLLLTTISVLILTLLASALTQQGISSSPKKEWDALDKDKDKIHDVIKDEKGPFEIMIVFDDSISPKKASSKKDDLHLSQITTFETFNWVAAHNVTKGQVHELSKRSDVVFIELIGPPVFNNITGGLDVATRSIKARSSPEYFPNTLEDRGLTGSGINICVIDSGVDDNIHESLIGKFVGGFNAITDTIGNPDDDNGHGTRVAGIALGTGGSSEVYRGVAPEAGLIDVKVLDATGHGTATDIVQGVDFCRAHRLDMNISILSISIQSDGPSRGLDAMSRAVNRAVDDGLIASVCAGNHGPAGSSITAPGAADNAITVGALDDFNTIDSTDDTIASYSSRGPRLGDFDLDNMDELKPDITAAGSNIIAPVFNSVSTYSPNSGCSFATPLVAGAIALMLESDPSLSPLNVKMKLRSSAIDKNGVFDSTRDVRYDTDYGWGEVDAFAASAGTLSVGTDKSSYHVGEIAVIGGNVPYIVPNEDVTLTIFDSNGYQYGSQLSAPVANDGSFSYDLLLGGIPTVMGTFTINAEYFGSTQSATFSVINGLTIQTNRAAYAVGQIITFSGKVTVPIPNQKVSLIIYDSNGYQYGASVSIPVAADGTFVYKLRLGGPSTSLYSYTAYGTYFGETQSTSFNVIQGLTIKSDKPSYFVGQTITVSGKVVAVVPNQKVTVTFIDPNGYQYDINKFATVAPGGTYSLQFLLGGINTPLGQYTVCGNYFGESECVTFGVSQGLTVTTDKTSYVVGETINFSGKVAVIVPNQKVRIALVDPNGYQYGNTIDVPVAADGTYSHQFLIGNIPSTLGTYDASANYFGETRDTLFSLGSSLTIHTNKPSYYVGQGVIFSGKVDVIVPNQKIFLTIFDSNGYQYGSQINIPVAVDGTYSYRLRLGGITTITGQYQVQASYFGETEFTNFGVNQGITINTDKSSYVVGQTVTFSGKVSVVIPSQKVTLTIYDPFGYQYGSSITATVAAGGSFSVQRVLGGIETPSGQYSVWASYFGEMEPATFNVG